MLFCVHATVKLPHELFLIVVFVFLYPEYLIDLCHDLGRKFVHELHSLHILVHLLHAASAGDDGADVGVL